MINLCERHIILFIIVLLILLNCYNKIKKKGGGTKYDLKKLNEVYILNKTDDINGKTKDFNINTSYLLVYKNESYFMKISSFLENCNTSFLIKYFDKKSNNNNRNIIDNIPLNIILLNDILYETYMYKKIKRSLSKKDRDNIVEMVDYGFFDVNKKDFLIQLNGSILNLSENNVTGEIYSKGNIIKKTTYTIDVITNILNKYKKNNSYLVYIITKSYTNYDILWNAINIHNLNKSRLEMYIINTIKILQKLKRKIGFSHNDLHSHNLLVNIKNEKIKLFDFDISTISETQQKHKNKKIYLYILRELYKDSIFIILKKRKNILFSENPPTNNKELEYTLDLFRLIVEPYLDINEIVLDINLNIAIDFEKVLPKIIIENSNNDKILLSTKLNSMINKDLFDVLNNHNCLSREFKKIFSFNIIGNENTSRMRHIISWLLFGDIKKLHFLLNNIKINLE